MRPLLITDGAHLKGTYKGTNLVLVGMDGMDGNNQIIPIATGEVPNLAIIMDKHPAIILACTMIFPNAFHGYCCRHLMMNCKLKSDKLQCIFWKTCKAYILEEFQRRISDLRRLRLEAYKKLEDAGFETWSRAMCPANRYNYMTSNSAELINNLTRHVRKAPITMLIEWYKVLLQKWYCARREKYQDSPVHTISDWATHKVMDRMQKSTNWKVYGIHQGKVYQMDDRRKVHRVDLTTRSCTCHKWKLSGIPCGHVIAVGRVMGCTDCSDMTLAYNNNHRRSPEYAQAYNNMIGRSQEYEPAYTNNHGRSLEYAQAYNNMIGRSQEYEPAYTNNHGRSQEYEPVYNNMIRRSQDYSPAYNNNNRRSQEYE
ncbi:transposase, MuDR, MULE transposase domain protein, partial [Tanacetum coccineum]